MVKGTIPTKVKQDLVAFLENSVKLTQKQMVGTPISIAVLQIILRVFSEPNNVSREDLNTTASEDLV